MMCPETCCDASATDCNVTADQKTASALMVVLRDMTKRTQALSDNYNLFCETFEACLKEDLDALGMASVSARAPVISLEPSSSHAACREMNNGQRTLYDCHRSATGAQANRSQDLRFLQAQYEIPQGELKTEERKIELFEDENGTDTDSGRGGIVGKIKKIGTEENSQFCEMHANAVDPLRGFLEDIRRTIDTWSTRLVENHCISQREHKELPETDTSHDRSPSPVKTSASFGVSFKPPTDQDLGVIQTVPQLDEGNTNILQSAESDEVTNTKQIVRSDHAKIKAVHQLTQPTDIATPDNATVNIVQPQPSGIGDTLSQLPHKDVELTPQLNCGEVYNLPIAHANQDVNVTESSGCINKNWTSEMEMQNNHSAVKPNIDAIQQTGANVAQSRVKQLVKRPYHKAVTVVESPDWLPEGWITEVKIRGSGNSAGSKDKYYCDPVTNRKFRSKREVFCFLETGKVARHKSKPRLLLHGGKAGSAITQQSQCQLSSLSTGSKPASMAAPYSVPILPSCPAPSSCLFRTVSTTFRSSQPSEWLPSQSLAGSLVPSVFEHFPHLERDTTGVYCARSSSHSQWWITNSVGSWIPCYYKNSISKPIGGQDAVTSQGIQVVEMQEASETGHRQHSAAAATISLCPNISNS